MPNPKTNVAEDLPLLERCAEIVREHVTGSYDLFPDRLYFTLSRFTRDDYTANHFYTVALAIRALPEVESAALLSFLEDEYEDAHGGDVIPLEAALEIEGTGDGAEDGDQQRASLDPDDPAKLRALLHSNRLQSVNGRKLRRSIGHRLAEIERGRRDPRRTPRRAQRDGKGREAS